MGVLEPNPHPPDPDARLWPYVLGGALLALALLVLANMGEYEGGDAVLVLAPLALVFGGALGGLLGVLWERLRR